MEEPRIDLRDVENLLNCVAGLKRIAQIENPLRVRRPQLRLDERVFFKGISSPPNFPPAPNPRAPTSRERRAFWSDSLKVRPIAIASPTDFIAEVRVGSASGNFSKVKRGILVTT